MRAFPGCQWCAPAAPIRTLCKAAGVGAFCPGLLLAEGIIVLSPPAATPPLGGLPVVGFMCASPVRGVGFGGRGRLSCSLFGAAGWVVPRCVSSSLLWGRRARGVGLGGAMGLGGGAPVPGGGGGGCSWSFYGAGGRGCSPLGGLVVLWGLVVNPPPPPPGGVSFLVFPVVAAWGRSGGGGGMAALPAAFMLSRPSSSSTGACRGRSGRWQCSSLFCCRWPSPSRPRTCRPGTAWRSRSPSHMPCPGRAVPIR